MKKFMLVAALLALLCPLAVSAAERDTPENTGTFVALTAGEDLSSGVLAGVGTNGLAYGAKNTIALTAIGRVERTADAGNRVLIRRGVFRWDQNGTNTSAWISSADLGKSVYVGSTAVSVTLTPSGAFTNVLGKVWNVDASGVWVRSGY